MFFKSLGQLKQAGFANFIQIGSKSDTSNSKLSFLEEFKKPSKNKYYAMLNYMEATTFPPFS